MSQETVELVRRAYTALNGGDEKTLLSLVDPEIVIDASRAVFNPNTYVGLDGLREISAGMYEVWETIQFHPLEFVDAGERVVVVERLVGKGKGSGVEVAQTWGAVWTVRDGRIVRLELSYPDREAALAAAGLPA
jgi:ketosteroid isomerase-like protein